MRVGDVTGDLHRCARLQRSNENARGAGTVFLRPGGKDPLPYEPSIGATAFSSLDCRRSLDYQMRQHTLPFLRINAFLLLRSNPLRLLQINAFLLLLFNVITPIAIACFSSPSSVDDDSR